MTKRRVLLAVVAVLVLAGCATGVAQVGDGGSGVQSSDDVAPRTAADQPEHDEDDATSGSAEVDDDGTVTVADQSTDGEVSGDEAPVDVPLETVVPISDDVQPSLPVVVASADGRDVEVTSVERIVPLTGSLAEAVFALGLGDRIVGRDVAATFPGVDHLPLVTRGHQVSAEGVLSLQPTLVLADTTVGPPEALDQIRNVGVPVVIVEEVADLPDIEGRIRSVAGVLGVPDAGEELVARVSAEIENARSLAGVADGTRVAFLYLRGTASIYLIGGDGSGADSLVEALGAVDAGSAAGLDKFTPMTAEALAAAGPDVILVMQKGLDSVGGIDGLVELPGVAQTPAGRDRRVIAVEDGLLLGFGPRTGGVMRYIATQLDAGVPAAP